MSGLLVPSKPWVGRNADCAKHLPTFSEDSYTLHKKYEGRNVYLGHPLHTHNNGYNIS